MAKEVLIADSDKADQGEFKKIFESTNYNLVFSESGEHALLRLKLFKPDLIIAGAALKEKNGLEVCKAIKADPELEHIPVILLSSILKDISEEDCKRVRADGIITKPFRGNEILNMVDRLIEEEKIKAKKEGVIGKEKGRKSVADIAEIDSGEKDEFFLDEVVEAEEVVDLTDVVEEPEMKMSIQDFIGSGKEELFTEIAPLESWEKLMEEEKPADRRFKFAPDEKEREAKGLRLQLGDEINLRTEVSEKELFEKVELEEILQKVEQMAPSIEKEWPPEEREVVSEERMRAPEAVLPAIEEPPEKYEGFAEFEAALKKGLGIESLEKEAPPFYAEKPKREAPIAAVPTEVSLEEELKKVEKEEFPESLLGEIGEEEVRAIVEPKEERMEIFKEVEIPEVEKEKIRVIGEPEEKRFEIFEELEAEAPEVIKEEVRVFVEPKEERMEIFEEVEVPGVEKEEIRVIEEPEEERFEIFEELETPEVSREEVRAFEKPKEKRIERFEKVTAPKVTTPIIQRGEIILPPKVVERQIEEVISKGTREVMEGFVKKLVPEMTQSIINLTIERIERMIKEIVPELAEKMIREEIKRLQKGEKD